MLVLCYGLSTQADRQRQQERTIPAITEVARLLPVRKAANARAALKISQMATPASTGPAIMALYTTNERNPCVLFLGRDLLVVI